MIFRSEWVAGLCGAASVKITGALLGFALTVVLARLLGPSEYGIYAWVMALVALLSVPVQLGLPTLLIREVARAQQQRDWGCLRGILRWSVLLASAMALLVGVAFLAGMEMFSSSLEGRGRALLWGIPLLPLLAWNGLATSALIGLRRVVLGQLPDNVLHPTALIGFMTAAWLFWPAFDWDAVSLMSLTVLSSVLTLSIASGLLRWKLPPESTTAVPVYRGRLWLTSLGPLALATGLYLVNSRTDMVMLGFFTTDDQVGIYRVATQMAIVVVFVLQVVNRVVAPHLARLHAAGDIDRLQRLVTRSAQITLLGAIPVASVFIAFGSVLLERIFGAAFVAGHEALIILVVAQLVNAGMGSVGLLLNMTGHERDTAKGVAVSTFLNVPLNFLLIPSFGITGAALATAISLVVWNIILWYAVRKRLGLNSTAFNFGGTVKHA
ncbi:MAG: flippase [Methylohalobius sp. ZOD2]